MWFSEIGRAAYDCKNDLDCIRARTLALLEIIDDHIVDVNHPGSLADRLFGGVMSLEDFARFVCFEAYTAGFLKTDEDKAVNQHSKAWMEDFPKDFEDPRFTDLSREEIAKLYEQCENGGVASLNRSVYRHLSKMLDEKITPRKTGHILYGYDETNWKPLYRLEDYDGRTRQAQQDGTPLGKTFFYQASTQAWLSKHNNEVFKWMTSERTRADKFTAFYYDFYHKLVRLQLCHNYDKDKFFKEPSLSLIRSQLRSQYLMTDGKSVTRGYDAACEEKYREEQAEFTEELTSYIAKAINLCRLEGAYRYNAILRFATGLAKTQPKYFDGTNALPYYGLTDLPPIFHSQMPPLNLYHHDTDAALVRLFLFCGAIVGHHLNAVYPTPSLYFDQYVDFFLSANDQERRVEEYRYYIIVLLAQIILADFKPLYHHQKFTWFIHNHYDIFASYPARYDLNLLDVINSKVARMIRTIASIMLGTDDKSYTLKTSQETSQQ